MGVVYEAEDLKLRRRVALKVLPPEVTGDAERRARFLREARAAAAVTHPNIATIYEVGEADGVVFIAMELVEGKTLRALIGGRAMPIKDALRVAGEIAEGLARAHQAGIVHRDLKPDNVIVGPDGHPKILDFGLARQVRERGAGRTSELSRAETISEEMTTAGSVLGTTAYMSPEQARGEPADARSDLFSFGVTLYEMVTGALPFKGKTGADVLSAIIRDAPSPPSQVNPSVPPGLDRIIDECLEKDPRDRYQHADQLVVDLGRLKRTTDSGARMVTGSATARPRRSVLALAGAAALGLGAAAALLFAWNVGGLQERLLGQGTPGGIGSLAVLPLVNLSRDPEQEYFADGMTDALIADLSKIGALRVISRTSVMRYKGSSKPLTEIVRELNVNAIIEGSILRSGDRVRITAQLVEGATDRHLWAESYERDLGDFLALQSEVAQAIAREIKVRLTSQEHARLAAAPAVAPGVYEAYLRGRYHWNKRTDEGLAKAIEHFEQVIERDPMFAPAYAGLADSYILREPGVALPRKEAYARARKAATRALEIDDTLSDAHTSMASIIEADYDWAGAEREYRRAIQLNPSYATVHHWYASYLTFMGRHDEAIAEIKRARDLDPLSLSITVGVGQAYMFARQYDQAIESCREALEMDPNFLDTRNIIGYAYEGKGMYAEAIAEFKKGIELSGGDPSFIVGLGHVYAVSGKRSEARKVVDELIELAKRRHVSPAGIAEVYAGLGEKDRALEFLEKAFQESDPQISILAVDPWMDPLRSDPRFVALLRRVGLPLPG